MSISQYCLACEHQNHTCGLIIDPRDAEISSLKARLVLAEEVITSVASLDILEQQNSIYWLEHVKHYECSIVLANDTKLCREYLASTKEIK